MIKIGCDPDNKAKYIKLTKHLLIATILITLSLSLIEIPKYYFGSTVEITDGQTADMTIAKIEDKDCQGRETINLDGKRYVVTDSGKKIASLTDDEPLHEAFGLYSEGKVVDNVCFLKPFNDCQGFWKGYFAEIKYFRDADGFIFPATTTYPEYQALKGNGGAFTNNGSNGRTEEVVEVLDKKTIKIPTEIKLKTEFFEGFGMQELIKTIIVGAIASVIAYVIYLITSQTLFSTLFVIGVIILTVVSLIKGQNNFSMIDSIKNLIKFRLMQREYKYTRGDFNNKHIKNI